MTIAERDSFILYYSNNCHFIARAQSGRENDQLASWGNGSCRWEGFKCPVIKKTSHHQVMMQEEDGSFFVFWPVF
jgi:hypothetical protein